MNGGSNGKNIVQVSGDKKFLKVFKILEKRKENSTKTCSSVRVFV